MMAYRLWARVVVAACAASCVTAPTLFPAFAGDRSAPATAMQPVVDAYHGTRVTDPYRWLEDGASPRVEAWSAAQNGRTRAHLDRLAIRTTLHCCCQRRATCSACNSSQVSLRCSRLLVARSV